MKPVYNTIYAKKGIKVLPIEVHYQVDGKKYYDPPLQVSSGDSVSITWNITIAE